MEITAENVSKVCRLCLKPEQRMRSTFEKIIDKLHIPQATLLSDLIMCYMNVKVSKNDGLPQNICLECVKNLHKTILFRKQVERNDIKLRKMLQIEDITNGIVEDVQVETTKLYWEDFDFKNKNNGHRTMFDSEGIFNCGVCHADFIEYEEFLKHDKSCNNSEKKLSTTEGEGLDDQEDPPNKLYCLCCDTSRIQNRKILSRHIKCEHKGTKRCQGCNRKFKSFSKFHDHLLLFSRKKSCIKRKQPCKRCGKIYYSSIRLLAHQLGHEWETDSTCKLCNMKYKRKSNILKHVEEHIHGKLDICRKCNKYYDDLERHNLVHTMKSRHKCDICGETFAFFTSLKLHVHEHI